MPGADWRAEAQKIKGRVTFTLARHGVRIDPSRIVFEEVYTPEDWRGRFGLYDGSAFGAAHTLFQVGPFRRRNFSEEIEGLYYVGASTTPGTGMPMVVLSGRLVAERIARAVFVERQGGAAKAYLALHGWGGDRRTFAPLAPFVPTCASLYSADLPGCGQLAARRASGRSQPSSKRWSRPRARWSATRVNLVGNCGGAVFALLAAQGSGQSRRARDDDRPLRVSAALLPTLPRRRLRAATRTTRPSPRRSGAG